MPPLSFLKRRLRESERNGNPLGKLVSPPQENKETGLQKRIFSLAATLALACLGPVSYADDYVPGEVLVTLKPGQDIGRFNQTFNTTTLEASPFKNSFRLAARKGVDVPTLTQQMTWDGRVVTASANLANMSLDVPVHDQFIFTADADTSASLQFIFTADQFIFTADQFIFTADRNPGLFAYMSQSTSSLIHYGETAKQYDGAGVLVAVLDTGISKRNPLLAPHVTRGWNFVNGNSNTDDVPVGIDSNGNGKLDEDAGHGTMVSGLINRYAQGATLLPVKVLDSDGSGSLWATIQGIRYAVAQGAQVVNMSYGSRQSSPLLAEAIADANAAGVLIVSAAGNSNSSAPDFPAGYENTLSVGSLDAKNVKASFTNYGSWLDVVAPGVGLPSTFWNGHYAAWSGTSFSAPLVSAEAALIFCADPDMSVKKVRRRIIKSASSVDQLNRPFAGLLGSGIINLDKALEDL